MKLKSIAKTMLILAGSAILFSCQETGMSGITLEAATERVNYIVEKQNAFKVDLTDYSFSSELEEYITDGWAKTVIRKSSLGVKYSAPYLINDDKTPYVLTYKLSLEHMYGNEKNVSRDVTVTRHGSMYLVTEGEDSHAYSPTTDSALASFINLPSLIKSNSLETLSLCSNWISSIGTPTAPNKTNILTSFEALGNKNGNFTLTFTGDSLPINQIYDDENSLPASAIITSLKIKCSNDHVDSYSSKYSYIGSVDELNISEEEIEGEISVSFTYGA